MSHSEKSYQSYCDIAALCWAATVTYVFSSTVDESLLTHITLSLLAASLAPLIYLCAKKYALGSKTKGALKKDYLVIITEFAWKYATLGFGICIIQFSIKPELYHSALNRYTSLLIGNIILGSVAFFFQKVWSNNELFGADS